MLVHFLTVVQVEVLLCVSFKVCGPLALSAACFLVATNLMPLWRGGSDLGSAKRATKAMRTIEDTLTIKPRRCSVSEWFFEIGFVDTHSHTGLSPSLSLFVCEDAFSYPIRHACET